MTNGNRISEMAPDNPDLQRYFDETAERETRNDLRYAVSELTTKQRIAVDCGCGAGADIGYLAREGFIVHAFDIEADAITRCQQRYGNVEGITLAVSTFVEFDYPTCSLVVADASLFFCPQPAFATVWGKIRQSLVSGGIFCGSFLGPDDTMAKHPDDTQTFWKEVLVLSEDQVRRLFDGFDLLRFTEHKVSGITPQGTPHDWHIFAVVAKKR